MEEYFLHSSTFVLFQQLGLQYDFQHFDVTTYHIFCRRCMRTPVTGLGRPLVDRRCKYHFLGVNRLT